jgi:hypothetical protein
MALKHFPPELQEAIRKMPRRARRQLIGLINEVVRAEQTTTNGWGDSVQACQNWINLYNVKMQELLEAPGP